MSIKIAINGFGRIGRLVGRIAMQREDIEIVAINDLGSLTASSHLFKYDSLHGRYEGDVAADGDNLIIDGKPIRYLSEKDPENLPWSELGVQVVVEGTGRFRSRDKAGKHLKAGAQKVVITAPGKNVDLTMVLGVNHNEYRPNHQIISMASCTTNCLAPVAKVLMEEFGIVKGFINTVHSYTNDQRILDLEHEDLRRARAAALSIIPTTTGAASALGLVIPELAGKLDGLAVRVPTPTGSLLDLTLELEKPANRDQINAAFLRASQGSLKGILQYSEVPLVSSDFRGSEYSAIVDGLLTMMMGDKMAKIIAWYDNEWAYSVRVVDTVSFIAGQEK